MKPDVSLREALKIWGFDSDFRQVAVAIHCWPKGGGHSHSCWRELPSGSQTWIWKIFMLIGKV